MKRDGWKNKRLKDVAPLQRGFDLTKANLCEGSVPVISSSGHWGYHNEAKVSGPGIVIGRYGTLGEVFFVQEDFWPHNTTLWVTDFCGNDPNFVHYLYRSLDISKHSAKTGVPGLNRNDLHTLKIAVPPVPEQQKIAAILSTWDQAIELTEKLIAAKQKRKQALMQQLLTGKVRFKKFVKSKSRRNTPLGDMPTDWKLFRFGKIVKKIKRKNTVGEEHVLTASGEFGLVDQREFFNRSVAGANLAGYYLLKRGEYAYNRSSMKGYPFGAIKRLNLYPQGVLSTLYICFGITHELCDSNYLCHFFEFRLLDRQLRGVTQVGGRAHGLLNITDSDFYSMKIVLPSFEEQQRIAAVLDTQDIEIGQLRKKLATLNDQKKGLMQQLLTGKVRVNVDAETVKG